MINHCKPYKMIKSRVKIFFIASRCFIISLFYLYEPDFQKHIEKYISSYTYK